MRALVLAALVACKPHVIELGTPDAHVDADISSCACRLRCANVSSTGECFQLGSGVTCGSDHFCTGSFGACTVVTSTVACNGSAAMSVCTATATSTATCGQ